MTVIVNVRGDPLHGLFSGVTVMVAVIGAEVALVALNTLIFPFPEAGNPIAVLLFVQE